MNAIADLATARALIELTPRVQTRLTTAEPRQAMADE